MNQTKLQDSFARQFYYLRLSLTDRCNFKCNYCLPNGYVCDTPHDKPQFLTLPEIEKLVAAFALCGIKKVRLTGGEPSLRKDLTEIISAIAKVPSIKKIAMTTNGYRLLSDAQRWYEAGLTHLNVSVDSLNPALFRQITGENKLSQVLDGIEKALSIGLKQVKVNAVLLKAFNDYQFQEYLEWIKDRPIQLRFIELMQTGQMGTFFDQNHYSGRILEEQLIKTGWQLKLKQIDDGPAKLFVHSDYQGEIGLIMPYEPHFCETCNRLRVSSLGKLHLCLFGEEGIDLRKDLSSEGSTEALVESIQAYVKVKPKQHFLHQGQTGAMTHLASLGG